MKTEPILLLFFVLAVTTSKVFSQDVAARMDAFNEAIGKEYIVSNKGKILVIEGFREGKQVKTDKVNVFDLDFETLKYSENDETVSVNCHSDLDGCVNRVLHLNKKKSYRQRVVFGIADGISGEEIAEKLRMLLNDMAKKY